VLVADLYDMQEVVDRRPALACVAAMRSSIRSPSAADAAMPDARLSLPVADSLVRVLAPGDIVTVHVRAFFDLSALEREPFAALSRAIRQRGADLRFALRSGIASTLDAAQRLGLRDAALRGGFSLWLSDAPDAENGAVVLATLEASEDRRVWLTRDVSAGVIGRGWGVGVEHSVVHAPISVLPTVRPIELGDLLPTASASVAILQGEEGRSLRLFGPWFGALIKNQLEPLGQWFPGQLNRIIYSDRYLRSPLTAALQLRAVASLRDCLASRDVTLPLTIRTAPLDQRGGRMPYLLHHDWQQENDRTAVLQTVGRGWNMQIDFQVGSIDHAREITIVYRSGQAIHLFMDQGFGYWQTSGRDRFEFGSKPSQQASSLIEAAPFIAGRGKGYIAVTSSRGHA